MASMQTTTQSGVVNVQGAPQMPKIESIPSNKKIDSMISEAQQDLKKQEPHLDSHGKKVVSSTQGVLDATSQLLNEKNKEERFQKLILWTNRQAQGGPSEGLSQAAQTLMAQATGIGSKISDDATDVSAYIRQTVLNLTTSSEFRQLAVEFLDFLQSLLGELKGAVKETQKDNQPLGKKLKNRIMYENDNERHDAINEKLSDLLEHIGRDPQYQNVVKNFIKYSEQIYEALYHAKEDAKSTKEAEDLRKTVNEAWEILHDFSGRDSNAVPKFKKSLTDLFEKINNDNELCAWAKECKQIIIDSMENPENTKKNQERTRKMIHQGEGLSDKYRNDLDRLYDDAQRIFHRIQSDPVIKNFQDQLEKLARDFALNSKGQPDLFVLENSMTLIKNLLIERFRKVLVDVPIRRIQFHSDDIDLLLTNISIQGTGLVPNHIHARFISDTVIDLQKSPDAQQKFQVSLQVKEIKPHFKNVNFSYEKKSFPTMTDMGVASLLFDGRGLSADIEVEFQLKSDQISKARLTKCSLYLEKVSLTISNATHDVLDTILTPILEAQIRTRLESGLQEYVQRNLNQILGQLNNWFKTKPFESLMKQGNESLQGAVEAGQRMMEQQKQQKHQKEIKESQQQRENKQGENKQGDSSLPWATCPSPPLSNTPTVNKVDGPKPPLYKLKEPSS